MYLTGGLALQLRLGLEGLPSSVAVPQLPREFVIGIGLLVVLPSIAVGWLAGWIEVRHPWRKLIGIATGGGLAVGALCYVVIGGTAGLALLAVLSLGGLALTIALGRCRRAPSGDRERILD